MLALSAMKMTPRSSESRDRLAFGSEAPIGQAATGDAATVDQASMEAESVARMNAPDVRAEGQRVPSGSAP